MESTSSTDERSATPEKLEIEKTREEESKREGIQIALNAVGLLVLFLSLALVVVLPLAEKIIYFYMGSLSFVQKEGLLTLVQALVLFGVYRAYRAYVCKKTNRR